MNWFESYLSDRSQTVQVESAFSPPLPVPYGVPQGSILGPLLFLIFVNELPDVIKMKETDGSQGEVVDNDADIIVYADDNTPFTADSDPEILQVKLQQEADSVTNWFEKNDMVISSEKTKLMIVTTDANRATKLTPLGTKFSVSVCNEVKDETNSEKLLGVVMNNQMTWKNHLYGDDNTWGC